MNIPDTEIKAVCRHEAGHYVIARKLGFKATKISVEFYYNGHSGKSFLELSGNSINCNEDLIIYLERRIQVLCAGVIAEMIFEDGSINMDWANEIWNSEGGRIDDAKIRELVHLLRNVKHPDTFEVEEINKQLEEINQGLNSITIDIVNENMKCITMLSEMLFHKVNKSKRIKEEYILTSEEIDNDNNMRFFFKI